jgi:hypothetical protein
MNKMTKSSTSNKLLAQIGKIIDEPKKQAKKVRAYLQGNRGIGFTSKSHAESKIRRKMAKKSRKINRRK